jgi:hypothetical protein
VRGQEKADAAPQVAPHSALTKRKAAVAAAVMIAAVLGAVAVKQMHKDGAAPQASAAASSSAQPAIAEAAPSASPPASSAAPTATSVTTAQTAPADSAAPLNAAPSPAALADNGTEPHPGHKKHAHPAPFANGPVHHGNVLHLKMDAPIDSIEGAQQPTGFTVKLPGRKSLEPAGPLAARDARIASIKVSNEPAGAELSVAFKDGVPNYQVSARGDTLVIAIAPAGMLDKSATAKKDGTSSATPSRGRVLEEKAGKTLKHPKHHAPTDSAAARPAESAQADGTSKPKTDH